MEQAADHAGADHRLDITEEAFDPQLNPIRAKVSLGMRVLNVNDVGFLNPAGALYMAYQVAQGSDGRPGLTEGTRIMDSAHWQR